MLRKFVTVIVFVTACTFSLYGQESERKNMAVLTFDARGVSEIESRAISDRIRIELARLGNYQMVERELMEQILEEQNFQLTGACTESSCLVEVGQLLAVHYMVGGSVTRIGNL